MLGLFSVPNAANAIEFTSIKGLSVSVAELARRNFPIHLPSVRGLQRSYPH
jgi:hypothetical protein